MSFPRYERCKDSGVEWLGEVPEHWDICRSRRLFAQRKELIRESDDQLTASQKHGIISQLGFMRTESRAVVRVIHGAEILKHVEPDDFVISMRSFQGGLEWSGVRGCISSAYVMLIPSLLVHPPFFRHLFKSDLYIQALQTTSNLVRDGQAMRYENFTLIDLPLPATKEQRQIALFLDQETEKIDALIEEKRRLIELLKEKRQAVISHAVAKGLDANAPTVISEAVWLGAVPGSWEVLPIKWLARVESGHTPDKKIEAYWEGGDVPWVSLNDTGFLRDNDLITETAYYTTAAGIENSSARLLPAGAVVFSRDATIGRCAITTRPMAVSQHFIAWICGDRVLPEYLLRVCHSMQQELERLSTGATIKTIGMADIGALVMPLPPMAEQEQIVQYIRRQIGQIDTLIAEANKAQCLLQERRSALISAAVTGKIDVRNYIPNEAV